MHDLLITLPTLLVRSEFCQKVVDAGGLDILKDLMVTFSENDVSEWKYRNVLTFTFRVSSAFFPHDNKIMKKSKHFSAPVILTLQHSFF